MSFASPRGANGLSSAQRAQLLDFADHYRTTDAGNSRLVIQAPSGARQRGLDHDRGRARSARC